jgi:hypothetical protein
VGPGNCIFNIITQEVPARMPSGSYTYFGYIGYYPDSTMNYDYFNFYKSPGNALSTDFIDWNISAWEAQNFNPLDNDPEFHFVTASPNPFNSGITVNFDIQSASVVELVIFNLLGEKVAVLAEGVYEQGLYSLKWDASNFPSGVYFYQVIIQAQDNSPKFQKVSKIVLMK